MMDVRKHWIKNLCNNMQKPMGRMGKKGDRIHQYMLIKKKITKKTHSGMIGLSSDSESLSCNDGDENLGGGAAKGAGRNDVLDALDLDLEYDNEGNQIIVPSFPPPIRRSPRQSIPVAATVNKEVQQQAPGGGNNNKEDITSPPALDALNGLKSTGSSIKSGKTKNLSNKNKECMSIAGAIVKLIEQGQPGGSSCEMSANMSVMLMRQLDSISRSMNERERREEKRRKKEHKRQKKVTQRRRGRRHGRRQPMKASRTMEAKLGGNTAVALIAIAATMIVVTAAAMDLPRAAIMVGGVGSRWVTTTDHLDIRNLMLLPLYDFSSLLSLSL
jgi:hypothetical protein